MFLHVVITQALIDIGTILGDNGRTLAELGLPVPENMPAADLSMQELARYSVDEQSMLRDASVPALLEGGRTAHSRFCLPISPHDYSTASIPVHSPLAKLLRDAAVLLWDEAPMMETNLFRALDRTLRDIMGTVPGREHLKHVPFGGKVFVMGGDFRQLLPVVKHGGMLEVVPSLPPRMLA